MLTIVPGTWRWMSKEIEKEEGGGAIGALLVGIVLLPADLALSRLYGSFTGLYYFGRAGDHLVEMSTVIPFKS